MIVSGGALRVTTNIINLRDYLLREISAKRFKCELDEDTLINQLHLSTYVSQGKKKLVFRLIDESIVVIKKLGLILTSECLKGVRGQTKYVFTLNEDFE